MDRFGNIKIFSLFLVLLSSSVTAGWQAELIYENYFGDYFAGAKKSIEFSPEQDSPKSLYQKLRQLVGDAKSNLLLVGCGEEDVVASYFMASKNLVNDTPLKNMIDLRVCLASNHGPFYFRFVNPSYSGYADPNSGEHFYLSPWRHLNEIGKKVQWR